MENCPMTLDIKQKSGDEFHVLFITRILYIVGLSMVFFFITAKALEEAHSGICGAHQLGPKLHFQIKRMGYY